MDVFLNGQRFAYSPSQILAQGGEAEIVELPQGQLLKVYKTADHPDFAGRPDEQRAVKRKLEILQRKLPNFPGNLPDNVVTPIDLARSRNGQVVGYTMRHIRDAELLFRFAENAFRTHVPSQRVLEILLNLHRTVGGIHLADAVIGDFNDLNVLVTQGDLNFGIDADSMQFTADGETFRCTLDTKPFVDPRLCDPKAEEPILVRPHDQASDWYSFGVIAAQSFLLTHPFGGIYRPKRKEDRVPQGRRPLLGISIFHPEVGYPKAAIHYRILPDDLLDYLSRLFAGKIRGEFPLKILEGMRWTRCLECGTEHARGVCPVCKKTPEPAIKKVTKVKGAVVVTRIFRTKSGSIVNATVQEGKPFWVYYDAGKYLREDGSIVVRGAPDPNLRFRIRGEATFLGRSADLLSLEQGREAERRRVDVSAGLPIFDTNRSHVYWTYDGQLFRDGTLGPEYIGNVLRNQTLFWVGEKFGFGFYRASQICVYFVFDAERSGINDTVSLPAIRGQLIDSTCVFSGEYAWFFTQTQESGQILNHCFVIRPDGTVKAQSQAVNGDGTWLGERIRGNAATGKMLFVSTDDGLIRCEPQDDGTVVATKSFPDTEPFLTNRSILLVSAEGIYAIERGEINLISMG